MVVHLDITLTHSLITLTSSLLNLYISLLPESKLRVDKSDNSKNEAYAVMTFKPTLLDRIKGKKDVAMRRKMDYSKLF
jgi:hypothetical protein